MDELLEKFRSDLEESMEMGLNALNFDSLKRLVESGSLYVFGNENAVIVFEKKLFGTKKVVNTVLCGGSLEGVSFLQNQLEADALEHGADGAMIIGRKGWSKVFDGYKNMATVYFKELAK